MWNRRVTAWVVTLAAAAAVTVGCGYNSGDDRADALCNMLRDDDRVAPDQLARRVYGDGQFATAAAGVRSVCVTEHGAVAVYLDQIANYDGSYELVPPPGYGTASQ